MTQIMANTVEQKEADNDELQSKSSSSTTGADELRKSISMSSVTSATSLGARESHGLRESVKRRKRDSRIGNKDAEQGGEDQKHQAHQVNSKHSHSGCHRCLSVFGGHHSGDHGKNHGQHGHGGKHGHGHGHAKKPTIVSALISGCINWLLMFGLCCAYGMIMFSDEFLVQHRALGVKLNLSTALIFGLLCSWKSKVAVAIGGPDLNPVIFLGQFVTVISASIARHNGLEDDYPESDSRRLIEDSSFDAWRRLGPGGGKGSDFCVPGGYHYKKHVVACQDFHEQLRATIIFATAVSSATLGLIYFCLGRFSVTRFVSYVPASVQEAFLSCIGYKVFKYALSFCNYQPLQFTPAACIGVLLYFLKAHHIGNPAVVIPVMLIVPLGIFHLLVFAFQMDIESMRTVGAADNWMFASLTHVDFWEMWTDSYGKYYQIDFKAWLETMPDLAIMVIVCVIDCLLQISSTESKIPVTTDKDYESQLLGLGNALTTLTGSSVGYMMLKFNVINYGVLGNVVDRRAGIVYAVLCGACFFGTVDFFNYLPRFFLGSLLFFAGSGFVAEHLWGSRKHLDWTEWCQIVIILGVFVFSGSLLAAVIVGILVTWVALTLKYSRISCLAGQPLKGGHVSSCERVNPVMVGQLSHIAESWFVVLRLKGFVFYASAQAMTAKAYELINERKQHPKYRHLKYIVLDCELLDGIDASAGKPIRKLVEDAEKVNVKLLWSHVTDEFAADLLRKDLCTSPDYAFHNLDVAALYIEDLVIEYQKSIQTKWLAVDPMFRLQHKLVRFEYDQDPWGSILLKFTARQGCPWKFCNQVQLEKYQSILWEPGEMQKGLYFLHSGRIAIYREMPKGSEEGGGDSVWPDPVAVYGHGSFLNQEFIFGRPTRHYAVAIDHGEALCWDREQWWKMQGECPAMAAEIAIQALDHDRATWLVNSDEQTPQSDNWQGASDEDFGPKYSEISNMDINSVELQWGRQTSFEFALPYDDIHRALLPAQLRALINSLEIAEVFGFFGAYEVTIDEEGKHRPPLPRALGQDLNIAFNTYAVEQDGRVMLPADRAMAALAYAGISRVLLAQTDHTFFSRGEFRHLGHLASMACLPKTLVDKCLHLIQDIRAKRGWFSELQADQIALILQRSFHQSFTTEIVQGLMDELGREKRTDEEMFLSICSRLFQRHEQYWNLLCAIRHAACPSEPADHATMNNTTFSRMSLVKLLNTSKENASELLWALDWPRRHATGQQWGKGLHIYDVALCVLTQVSPPIGGMHPPPVLSLQSDVEDSGTSMDTMMGMSDLIVNLKTFNEEFIEEQLHSNREVKPARLQKGFTFMPNGTTSFELQQSPESGVSTASGEGRRHDGSIRQRLHLLLEDPSSSSLANYVSLAMGMMIMISILTMIIRPSIEHGREDDVTKQEKDVWFVFELVLTIVFTIEYLVRLSVANAMSTQTTLQFIKTPANICDFSAIVPFYVEVGFGEDAEEFRLLRVVRLLRLTRIVRIGRLAKRSELFAPIGTVLLVIWGIYMKTGLTDSSK